MLVSAGAIEAPDEVLAVADALGRGLARAVLGKAAVPDDVPMSPDPSAWLAPLGR